MKEQLRPDQIKAFKKFQKDEMIGALLYEKISERIKDQNNADVLKRISEEEIKHYNIFKKYTQTDATNYKLTVAWYLFLSRVLGITFAVKQLERGEDRTQKAYAKYLNDIPELLEILHEEEKHENQLIELIDEERLKYAGSIVLGLNDALVELTGTLAGLSLAFQNTKLIAMSGLITGIAASFSMAASDYLSQKADGGGKDALKSSLYTGVAYIITVALLVTPYIFMSNYLVCLTLTLTVAILIILGFNYYISVAKNLDFKKRFAEMALISISVSAFSFIIGFFVKKAFGIDV